MDSAAGSEEKQPKTGRDKLGDLCESTPAHLFLMFLLLIDIVAISKGTRSRNFDMPATGTDRERARARATKTERDRAKQLERDCNNRPERQLRA